MIKNTASLAFLLLVVAAGAASAREARYLQDQTNLNGLVVDPNSLQQVCANNQNFQNFQTCIDNAQNDFIVANNDSITSSNFTDGADAYRICVNDFVTNTSQQQSQDCQTSLSQIQSTISACGMNSNVTLVRQLSQAQLNCVQTYLTAVASSNQENSNTTNSSNSTNSTSNNSGGSQTSSNGNSGVASSNTQNNGGMHITFCLFSVLVVILIASVL